MCGRFDYFLDAFANLEQTCPLEKGGNAETGCYSQTAALLLIVVLDCIENRSIVRNFISPSPGLEQRFHRYCKLIMVSGQQECLATPFRQLASTGFWELKPQPGKSLEKLVENLTISELRSHYFGAKFSDDLYPLLQMTTFRRKLRQVLIKSHFNSEEQLRVHDSLPHTSY